MKSNYRETIQAHGCGWYGATWMRPVEGGKEPQAVVFRLTEYRNEINVVPIHAEVPEPTRANIADLFGVRRINEAMKQA